MGYNIGLRLIEDYLAKSNTMKRCVNFRETADMIARVRVPPCTQGPSTNDDIGWVQDIPQHHTSSHELDN